MVYGRSRPSPQEFVFLRTSHPFLDGCPLLLLGLEISVHVYMAGTLVALFWCGHANL